LKQQLFPFSYTSFTNTIKSTSSPLPDSLCLLNCFFQLTMTDCKHMPFVLKCSQTHTQYLTD